MPMACLIVPCPAKVNLFLAVGPKDRRGYHPLRTVFQSIGLFDEMRIELGGAGTSVEFASAEVPRDNTVTKTLRLLQEIVDVPPMAISVTKRIPTESGLGGGSSDAAGLIRAVTHVRPGKLAETELQSVALAVGADVPFFLVGGRASAEGYGERLTPLPDPLPSWMVIVKPSVGCPTAAGYGKLDAIDYEWRGFPEDDVLYNDFERVAPCECLEVIERLQALGAKDAGLSGSGSAVFGRFASRRDAETAAERLEGERLGRVWPVPTLTRQQSLEIRRENYQV
jgi:4-diphosphocytidyl-2-C-methyl-D-erythritol kinase